jgi:cell division protein FtsI/penicillin-binding protein 2
VMRADRMALVIVVCVLAGMAIVVARVAQLQLATPERLVAHMPDRESSRPVEGYRGELHDRVGRLVATSRMGYRVFVDPVHFSERTPAQLRAQIPSIDEAILQLAAAIEQPPAQVGERVLRAIAINRERTASMFGEGNFAPPDDDQVGGLQVLLEALHARAAVTTDRDESDVKGLRRYEVVSDILKPHQIAAVQSLRLPGVHLERRAVREYPGGDLVASLVGKVGFDQVGLLGAESLLDEQLLAQDGRVRYVRDAWGRPLWIERGAIQPPTHGDSIRLSLDLEIQRIAIRELERGVEDADAAGGRIVVADPLTGEILAMADMYRDVPELVEYPWQPKDDQSRWVVPPRRYRTLPEDLGRLVHPGLGRNRCVEDVYEPGSTFKPVVWALLTEAKLAAPTDVIDTEGGRWRTAYGRGIEDVTKRAQMTWSEVLEHSSNIGMVKIAEKMPASALHNGITRFGFGTRTGTKLAGEASGIVTTLKDWTKYSQTSVAFGHEISVTPVQMVRAYCALVRTGPLAGTMPTLRMTAPTDTHPANAVMERVVGEAVTLEARIAMRRVGEKIEQRMVSEEPAGGWWYAMLGKSGTAEIPLGAAPKGFKHPRGVRGYYDDQYNSSFLGAAPAHKPRLVVIVIIDDPGPEKVRSRTHYGSAVAGPVVRRVLEQSLRYLGVEGDGPSRTLVER